MKRSTLQSYTSPRPDIVAAVPLTARRILDVGCSSGALGASLRDLSSQPSVHGIEFDPAFCEEARARLDNVVRADLNAYRWDADYKEGYFDCIIFADVLEHLNRPWDVLKDSLRLLAPEGVVILSFPNIRHLSALNSILFRGTFPRADRGIFDRTHIRWFTLADGLALCQQASLSVMTVSSNLRLFDAPAGKINELVQTLLCRFQSFAPIREFLSYQFVLVARRAP